MAAALLVTLVGDGTKAEQQGYARSLRPEVILFGPGGGCEPTAQDWATALGTISYEITTRIVPRVPRRYVRVGDCA